MQNTNGNPPQQDENRPRHVYKAGAVQRPRSGKPAPKAPAPFDGWDDAQRLREAATTAQPGQLSPKTGQGTGLDELEQALYENSAQKPPAHTGQQGALRRRNPAPGPQGTDGKPLTQRSATKEKGFPNPVFPLVPRLFGKKNEGKAEKQPLPRKKLAKRLALAFCALLLLGIVGFGFFFVYTTRNDDLWLDLDNIPYRDATILYYTDQASGQTLEYTRLPCTQNRLYTPPEEMPDLLRQAFIAVEDKKFYRHHGFDPRRTLFALLNEAVHKVTGSYIGGESGRRQGASTITQQLIKNLTRDDDDSDMAGYMRKLREVCRAIRLDALYDKDDILDAYLNSISFTGNTAGVGAEAQKLFGKSPAQLTVAECASLAAITRNPARYNPVKNPEEHLSRRNYVLGEMLAEGYISAQQHADAVAEPLNLAGNSEPPLERYVTSYFTDTVIDAVISQLSQERGLSRKEASNLIYNGGLRIYTTVVPQVQQSMEQVMANSTYHPRPSATVQRPLTDDEGNVLKGEGGQTLYGDVQVQPQAAMVSLDYDGGICAVVGGLGQKEISRGFNRATSAVRQVGSTMKPIGPYVTALESGYITWSTSFPDKPVSQVKDPATGLETPWPANVTKTYSERDILVREAMAHSVNTVAVRVGRTVGNRGMYQFVTGQLGISTFVRQDAAPGPLVLGSSTYGISPLEMAAAYAMFGNGGYSVNPHCYTKITNGAGLQFATMDAEKKRVIAEDTAYVMNRLLREVVTNGTAAGMQVPDSMDSVGKTGTTSDNRDHWFVGLTPYYVTASWYGYDENLHLAVNNRQHPPTLAWRAVMQSAQQNLPVKNFPESSGAVQADYCTHSGKAPGPGCPTATGWYRWWHRPLLECDGQH